MNKSYFLLFFNVVLLTSIIDAKSQMFDWQYSVRLPFESPKMFIGGGVAFQKNWHSATNFREINEELHCGNYRSGAGSGVEIFASGEYWRIGESAIGFRLKYSQMHGVFDVPTDPTPFKLHGEILILRRNFILSTTQSFLSAEFYGKWLLDETHIFAGAGLGFNIALSNSFEQTESIISPEQFTAAIPYGKVEPANITNALIKPSLQIGYDAELARGIYASPYICIALPIFANSPAANWRVWTLSAGVQINYGLLAISW